LIEYAIYLHGLAPQWGHDGNKIWHKGSLGGEHDARTSNTCIAHRKSRDTTLDDEKYDVHYRDWGRPVGKSMIDGT